MEKLKETAKGVQLKIRVQPRAAKNQVVGWLEDALKVRLTAPPVDGEANAALQRFLADYFGIPRSEVELIAGATGRIKMIRLNGMTAAEDAKRLNC